jgi:hypothetical protein
MNNAAPFAFRIVGACTERRRLIEADAAFRAYASCDERAEPERESYLSAFQFGEDFRQHLESTGSTKGFQGLTWSQYLWFDIDNANDPQAALDDARHLVGAILERYSSYDEDGILYFFSGSKGYHAGIPIVWDAPPSLDFHLICRRIAEGISALAKVQIDAGIYDKVRAFRAPNSKHPKTGLHKRRLSHGELMGLSLDRIRQLAASPTPFDLPTPPAKCERAAADWHAAAALVREEAKGKAERRAAVADGSPRLNRQTFDFIKEGAATGDRHRLLFSAAANLAEFNCPASLATALLTEAALDSGLSPSEVKRQVECGLNYAKGSTNE